MINLNRYWISWQSGNYADEGCTKPPFQYWITGYCDRPFFGLTPVRHAEFLSFATPTEQDEFLDRYSRDNCIFCAMVDATNEDEIWEVIKKHFPDCEIRFCNPVELNAVPGNEFTKFENRTALYYNNVNA